MKKGFVLFCMASITLGLPLALSACSVNTEKLPANYKDQAGNGATGPGIADDSRDGAEGEQQEGEPPATEGEEGEGQQPPVEGEGQPVEGEGPPAEGEGALEGEGVPGGQSCVGAADCPTGYCADGVCCDMACEGICMACDITGQEGTCTAVADGADPHNDCLGEHEICGGVCDGIGHCRDYPDYAVSCGNPGCFSAEKQKSNFCNGQGECQSINVACAPYVCSQSSGSCKSSCSSGADCASGATCQGGVCKYEQLLANGAACGNDAICQSGRCVDGVCCDAVCDKICESCNLPGSAGTCRPVLSGEDPGNECGNPSCEGACNGARGCDFGGSNSKLCGTCTICNNGACISAQSSSNPSGTCGDNACAGSCDGLGKCAAYPNGTRCTTCKQCDGRGGCFNVPIGLDPFADCTAGTVPDDGCDEICDGQGACASKTGDLCGAQDGCKICDSNDCQQLGDGNSCQSGRICCSGGCCPSTTPHCRNGVCAQCTADAHCSAPKPKCKDGTCVQCLSDTDCGTCKRCAANNTCQNVSDGTDPRGQCAACKICRSGACANADNGTDPKNDCQGAVDDSCDGNCNGLGACTGGDPGPCAGMTGSPHPECWACAARDCTVPDPARQCQTGTMPPFELICKVCGSNGACAGNAPNDYCCSAGCYCNNGLCKDCGGSQSCDQQGDTCSCQDNCLQPNPVQCAGPSCCCECDSNGPGGCLLQCGTFNGSSCCTITTTVDGGTLVGPICCDTTGVKCSGGAPPSTKCCDSTGLGVWGWLTNVNCN